MFNTGYNFVVLVDSSAEYFEVKDVVRDVGALSTSGFEVENIRGYPGSGCSVGGVADFDDE